MKSFGKYRYVEWGYKCCLDCDIYNPTCYCLEDIGGNCKGYYVKNNEN